MTAIDKDSTAQGQPDAERQALIATDKQKAELYVAVGPSREPVGVTSIQGGGIEIDLMEEDESPIVLTQEQTMELIEKLKNFGK